MSATSYSYSQINIAVFSFLGVANLFLLEAFSSSNSVLLPPITAGL